MKFFVVVQVVYLCNYFCFEIFYINEELVSKVVGKGSGNWLVFFFFLLFDVVLDVWEVIE